MTNNFTQRKSAILSKLDKSSIGKWDKKIISLCEKLNKSNNCYTTSSCSGRVVLMIDQEKKSPGLFLAVSHSLISFDWLKKNLKRIENEFDTLRVYPESFSQKMITKGIKFKCEPVILHVACRDLESASALLEKAKRAGLKHSGINALGKNIILELNGSDRLEFPVIKDKILVSDDFLKLIVKQANEKLKRSWNNIEKLRKAIR